MDPEDSASLAPPFCCVGEEGTKNLLRANPQPASLSQPLGPQPSLSAFQPATY